MPINIISALAETVLPAISSAVTLKDKKLIKNKISFTFRTSFIIPVSSTFFSVHAEKVPSTQIEKKAQNISILREHFRG